MRESPLQMCIRDSYNVEGNVSFKALLYIPGKAPYDFYTKDYKRGLQLYSSGVLIMDNCEDLLPEHFRFVRGVVDSQDPVSYTHLLPGRYHRQQKL